MKHVLLLFMIYCTLEDAKCFDFVQWKVVALYLQKLDMRQWKGIKALLGFCSIQKEKISNKTMNWRKRWQFFLISFIDDDNGSVINIIK